MATKIIHKKSSVAASVPVSADIAPGELALNLADQKIYSKQTDGTIVEMAANPDQIALTENCKNVSGVTLTAGTVVYQSGTAGNAMEVQAADSTNSAKMPAIGVIQDSLASGAEGKLVLVGFVQGLDTSTFSEGETLYVNTGGDYQNIVPTGSGTLIQNIGKVIKVHASNGSIMVTGAGRANATPNLDTGDIFIGNGSNQSSTASFNDTVDAHLNQSTASADEVLSWDGSDYNWTSVANSYLVKTTAYTAVAGDNIIANTSGGVFTITLPASPSAGDTVVIADGASWSTNNLTVARNGSTIEGDAEDMTMDLDGVNANFVYDGTTWQVYAHAGITSNLQAYTETEFTATASQTTFTVDYTAGKVDVHLNGVKLANADYTATNGTTIVLTTAAAVNDILNVVAWNSFTPADTATSAQGALADTALQTVAFSDLTTTPTTVAGYGITDASTTSEMNTAISTAVSNLVDSSPSTLDTLNELAAALGDDPNFATTTATSLGEKLPKAGGAMTGAITTNSTFDGRNVSVDGAKLDGIEAGANVTDTANVVAALTAGSNITIAANGTIAGAAQYTHPTYAGDDASVDTGALSGATVISDLDFNITTDTLGHVTDANATVATRNLTLGNLGFTGATNANYITNNNQLSNGAGYTTYSSNQATNTTNNVTFNQINCGPIISGQINCADVYSTGWFRTTGTEGVYFGTYTGGWHMTDTTWIRAYNNKSILTSGTMQAGTFNTTSDERTKKDIKPIENALEKVQQLGGYSFTFKATDEKSSGVIAQEVQKVMPELVQEGGEGHLTVQYGNMVGLLIEAIKEQQAQIDELKSKLNS